MQPGNSLADGNRFQRAYDRWAQPYYAKMAPEVREQSILIDRFLYSRRGLGFWLGLLAAFVGSSLGLRSTGMPWWFAILLSLLLWVGLPLMLLVAWLQPTGFSTATLRRIFPRVVVLAAFGALAGFATGHVARRGELDLSVLLGRLWEAMGILAPAVILASGGIITLMWGVASVRRQALERELARLKLEQERDAATRQAAQAQLKLLQVQIQPHFIFNTLSAVQHWVDQGDARAGSLLRSLTAFLRGSTEAMGRDQVALDDEVALVRHYLEVMQARLGDRLSWSVIVEPEVAPLAMPPGLLLTLVENAIEHGISASLSGGRIELTAQRDADAAVIRLLDSAGLWDPDTREGLGLSNSRARLQHRYGAEASLTLGCEAGQTVATLRLPLRPQSLGLKP